MGNFSVNVLDGMKCEGKSRRNFVTNLIISSVVALD